MNKGVNMTNVTKIITVDLSQYANGYIATSKDAGAEGLFLAYKSFDKLLKGIPVALRLLMRAKYGVNYSVLPENSVEDEELQPVKSVLKFYAQAA